MSDNNIENDEDPVLKKYTDFKSTLKCIEEEKDKVHKIVYKNPIRDDDTKNTNFVLNQIKQDVTLLETSSFSMENVKIRRLPKNKSGSNDFFTLADLKEDVSDTNNKSASENFDSHWDYNTQLAEIVDNADALFSMMACSEIYPSPTKELLQCEKFDDDVVVTDKLSINKNAGESNANDPHFDSVSLESKLMEIDIPKQKYNYDTLHNKGFTSGSSGSSNKKITVSDEVLLDAEKLFSDIDNNLTQYLHEKSSGSYHNFTSQSRNESEMDESPSSPIICSQTVKNSNRILRKKSNDRPNKCNNTNILKDRNSGTLSTKNQCIGFMTANNKEVVVSAEALSKSKRIFENLDDFKIEIDENLNNFAHGKCEFVGFSTANNKKINVSKDALNKARAIFDDKDVCEVNCTNLDILDVNESLKPKLCAEFENVNKIPTGFTTANNKRIDISKTALDKVKTLFDEILEETELELPDMHKLKRKRSVSNNGNTNFGFTTASNKKIKVSIDALNKAKTIFDDITDCQSSQANLKTLKENEEQNAYLEPKIQTTSFAGFMTASNKSINISEDALKKVKNLFDEPLEDHDFGMLKTNSNDNKTDEKMEAGISEISKNKNKKAFDESFSDSTTNNKKVKTLNKSEKVFNNSQLSQSNLITSKNSKEQNLCSESKTFTGFMTASNKSIEISEDALKKVKDLFDEPFEDDDFAILKTNSNDNTSSDEKNISEIEKSEAEISEKNKGLINKSKTKKALDESFSYATANKKVKISNKSEKIFDDMDKCQLIQSDLITSKENKEQNLCSESKTFTGFMTASNKSIDISEDALKKVNNLFDEPFEDDDFAILKTNNVIDEFSTEMIMDNSKFCGFSTANNKKINISNDALNKAKAIFKEVERDNDGDISPHERKDQTNVGFVTASNKSVQISENALKKVKNIFDESLEDYDTGKANGSKSKITKILENNSDVCYGFSTASDKKVEISSELLSTAKIIFDDVTGFQEDKRNLKIPNKIIDTRRDENVLNKKCNQGNTVPSLKALSMKVIMNGTIWLPDDEEEHEPKSISQEIIECTSALLEDENSKLAEIAEPPSSPILLFKQNLKRRNFKVPYKKQKHENDDTIDKIHDKKDIVETPTNIKTLDKNISNSSNLSNTICLGTLTNDKTIRGSKVTSLKDIAYKNNTCKLKVAKRSDMNDEIYTLSPQNFDEFKFEKSRLDIVTNVEQDSLAVADIVNIFTNHEDVDRKLIPDGWVLNHVKWIMWKLASYERTYTNLLRDELVLTASNVLSQLKYRYDRELYRSERPILRKVLEKDEVPTKRMVLCVSNIIQSDEKNADDGDNRLQKSKYEIELTDGWYAVITVIDSILSSMIDQKRIVIGTKLIIYGAELLNCPQGVAPLENNDAVRLKIWANICRRCAYWVKLGLCKNSNRPLPLKLNTCRPGGGPISNLLLVPVNVYPMLHLNKSIDGAVVMKSDRVQQIDNVKIEADLQAKVEQLYNRVEKEFNDEEFNKEKSKNKQQTLSKRKSDDLYEDLIETYETIADPVEFLNSLSPSQRELIQRYTIEKQDKIREQVNNRVRELMDELMLTKKQIIKVLKCRVLSTDSVGAMTAILTIWKPSEATIDLFKEGTCLNVTNLTPTGIRSGELHLSAGNRSIFMEVPFNKHSTQFSTLDEFANACVDFSCIYKPNFAPKFNEVNIVGIVIDSIPKLGDFNIKNDKMQTVYMADENMNFIGVNFWGGVNKYGFDRIIEKGTYLACSNFQYRPRSLTKRIRQLYVTEFSNFSRCPKRTFLRTALDNLQGNIKHADLNAFLQNCNTELSNLTNVKNRIQTMCNNVNILNEAGSTSHLDSDSRFANAENELTLEMSKSKVNISSILSEHTLNANDSLSLAEIKMNKLKAYYGEPPSLSPIVMKSSSRINKNFINPCNVDFGDSISALPAKNETFTWVSNKNENRQIDITDRLNDDSPPMELD